MEVILVAGEALLSAFLQVLVDRLASRDFLDLFKAKKPIEELLQRIRTKLRSADVLIKDAEEKQLTDQDVRSLLHGLKEVIFRADELADKIDYEVLRRKLEGASTSSTFSADLEKEMEKILADLDDHLKRNAVLDMNALSLRSHATPLVRQPEVYGREFDKEAIMKLVLLDEDCGDKIPVLIPIVGMDGIGKTTLAQLVYYDQRVKEHFEIRVWVSVSTESAVLNITKWIFEQVKSNAVGNTELSLLQGQLEEALAKKKFLFVLDDVWVEDLLFWHQLRPLFTFGKSGSKIIITTSSSTVAERAVKETPGEIYHLGVLENSFCWEFFSRHALKKVDLRSHPDIREIGEEIVQKCQGQPLAIKYVADSLGSKSLEEWRMISDGELQEITSRCILRALWLSYSYLSPELKSCFAYCSIFPKDHEFLKGEVILLWMAEGLLQSKGGKTMEDVGDDYFKILTSRSFFQPVKSKSSFTMHGCMHDLATFVLGHFGFRLEENNLQNLPKEARHLSIMRKYIRKSEQFKGVFDAKFLRTFLALKFNGSSQEQDELPLPELITEEKLLRVVSLPHYLSIKELPDSVEELKHLRYLDLSNTAIKVIPSKICSLYNLETLLLRYCRNLNRLPADIGRLVKLRHLDFDGSDVEEFAPQICNLKELQTLTKFIVCEEDGGSRIKELGDLQHLHGKFDILGLQNVVDVQNVSAAKLSDKKFRMLGLYWNDVSAGSGDPGQHSLVLDQLQPHRNLEELRISGYNGTSFSDWMGDQYFCNIVKVELFKCGNCNYLSPIGQLPSLKELWISEWLVEKLEFKSQGSSMTGAFKHLEDLYFLDMQNWKEWSFTGGEIFPCLKQLQFHECPKLDVRLPDCFPALTKLVVNSCRQLRPCSRGFSSLKELQIFDCPKQEYFSNDELGLPSSVKIRVCS